MLGRRFLAGLAFNVIGGVAIMFAILIIVGAYLMYIGMTTAEETIVMIFSILSLFVDSGLFIGLILGLVGGVLRLLRK